MYTATLSTANLNNKHRVEAIDSGFPVLGSPHCRIHVERANKEKGKGVRKERWASENGRKTESRSIRFSGMCLSSSLLQVRISKQTRPTKAQAWQAVEKNGQKNGGAKRPFFRNVLVSLNVQSAIQTTHQWSCGKSDAHVSSKKNGQKNGRAKRPFFRNVVAHERTENSANSAPVGCSKSDASVSSTKNGQKNG